MKRAILKFVFRVLRLFLPKRANAKRMTSFAIAASGSLGDQAMMDVIRSLSAKNGMALSVITSPDIGMCDLRGPFAMVIVDDTIASSIRKFSEIARSAYVVAIGADIIDGSYNPAPLMRWFNMIEYAQEFGCKTAIINFSFSEQPDQQTIDRLSALRNVFFAAREAVSHARFEKRTHQKAQISSDMAILLEPEITSDTAREALEWLRFQRANGNTILAVNASGHTLTKMGDTGADDYVRVLSNWLNADPARALFLLPHDFRPAPIGDVEALDKVEAALALSHPGRIYMIRPPFEAWDVKALMGHVDGLITGRMHLAIAGLGMHVPPLSIVYRGKFEGLMQHFGLDGLLVEPEAFGDVGKMNALLEEYTQNLPQLRDQVERRLPEVKQLAMRNFDWLERNLG